MRDARFRLVIDHWIKPPERETAMLQISTEKVARIIVRAREFDAKVAPWDDSGQDERQDEAESILEDTPDDPIASELRSYIDDLNEDEQVSLVALMWIGRGTYEAADISDAMSTARSERVNETSAYLLGVPLLADYLEEGLEKLGYQLVEIKEDIL
jgi:hypothetical protein